MPILPSLPVPGTTQGGTQPSQSDMQSVIIDALNRRAQGQQNQPSSTVPGVAPGAPQLQGTIGGVSAPTPVQPTGNNAGQPLPPGMPATQTAPVASANKSTGPQFDDETKTAAKVLMAKLLKTI